MKPTRNLGKRRFNDCHQWHIHRLQVSEALKTTVKLTKCSRLRAAIYLNVLKCVVAFKSAPIR